MRETWPRRKQHLAHNNTTGIGKKSQWLQGMGYLIRSTIFYSPFEKFALEEISKRTGMSEAKQVRMAIDSYLTYAVEQQIFDPKEAESRVRMHITKMDKLREES